MVKEFTKQDMRKTEALARKLMTIDSAIWRKHGWGSGGEVQKNIYVRDLNKLAPKGRMPILIYYVLEDANFHTLNNGLEGLGRFKGRYGSKEAESQWEAYRRLGGRTWKL